MWRRWGFVAGAALLTLLLWVFWGFWREPGSGSGAARHPENPPGGAVARSSWLTGSATLPSGARGTLSIQGQVVGPDGPVPGVLVAAIAPPSPEWLSRLPPLGGRWPRLGWSCDPTPDTLTLLGLAAERRGHELPPLAQAVTDGRGNFRLENLEEGVFTLWAESGAGLGVLKEVVAGSEGIEVQMGPGRVFSGVVHDERGRAVVGALVTALQRDVGRFIETATDEEGRFQLGPLPWVNDGVILSKQGLLPASRRAAESGPDHHEVVLFAPWQLSGHVVDERGPVPGVTVQLEDIAQVPPTTTDARGHFGFEGLCRMPYFLVASSEGRYARKWVSLEQGLDSVEILLGASVRLSGQVTDPSGRPIEGAEVSVSRAGGWWGAKIQPTQTDSRGRFLSEPFESGTYGVSIQAMRYVRRELPPRLLQASEELRVSLKEALLVEGHTVDAEGSPVEGVELSLVRAGSGAYGPSFSSARTGAEGAFTLNAPDTGPWLVRSRHPDFREEDFPLAAPAEDVRLVMRNAASLEVELVDEKGRPVRDAVIRLTDTQPGYPREVSRATTSAEGKAVFQGMKAGRYTLLTKGLGGALTRRSRWRCMTWRRARCSSNSRRAGAFQARS
ncbi:collagen binding domain-containing protein [Vitiosangium sp. GDMCC 1.1324]|uniref:MSCRAMM family protein n=1 Tax=Vitiosangium sp. (strain GDMCC 1.1324) TaxID=2138576 RepID=UPI00130EFC98|nr:carboxypeptidase regulatory-like domain-containing protein [Vitiosangium sp. GDMCC 1.1324]